MVYHAKHGNSSGLYLEPCVYTVFLETIPTKTHYQHKVVFATELTFCNNPKEPNGKVPFALVQGTRIMLTSQDWLTNGHHHCKTLFLANTTQHFAFKDVQYCMFCK